MNTRFIFLLCILSLGIYGCKKQDLNALLNSTGNTGANNFIYSSMKEYYLWADSMPSLNKTNIQILFIILIIVGVIIYLLKSYDKIKFADYLYYTGFIYIIGILTLLILNNSILTYNTYINKYLIYEPIAYYKEDFNNTNALFNALLLKDIKKEDIKKEEDTIEDNKKEDKVVEQFESGSGMGEYKTTYNPNNKRYSCNCMGFWRSKGLFFYFF